MKDCPQCGCSDSMYNFEDGYKCYECQKITKRKLIADSVPTRKMDSECGDIISSSFKRANDAAIQKCNCNNGNTCSITPQTTIQIKQGVYMVVCGIHKDKIKS